MIYQFYPFYGKDGPVRDHPWIFSSRCERLVFGPSRQEEGRFNWTKPVCNSATHTKLNENIGFQV